MVRRLLGLGSFVVTALWIYFWEWIRSQIYERAQHMLGSYFEWVTPDVTAKYLPPAVFILVGLWLFWSTRPKPAQPAIKDSAGSEIATVTAPDKTITPARNSYLKEAHVYAGMAGNPETPPRVIACFSRSGRNAEACIDFSHFVGGIGFAGWSKRRRLLIKEIKSYDGTKRSVSPLCGEIWSGIQPDGDGVIAKLDTPMRLKDFCSTTLHTAAGWLLYLATMHRKNMFISL